VAKTCVQEGHSLALVSPSPARELEKRDQTRVVMLFKFELKMERELFAMADSMGLSVP
jgi:hypothetical protein